jgi:tetratricopeptide (TPR) repeat protein
LYDQISGSGKLTEVEYQMYGDMFMAGKTEDAAASEKYILKAADAYKKAFELNPKNFASAFNIGIAFYNQYILLDEQVSKNIRALQNLNANKPVAPKDPVKKKQFEINFKAQQDSIKKLNVVLEAPIQEKVDNAIEWITKAFNVIKDKETLVRAERNVAGRSVDFLTTLYAFKRDKARGKDQKAMDAYDVLYNIYDKLHDKYN